MRIREVYSHFNLSGNPFSKENKTEFLKALPGVKEAEGQLQVLFDTKGIGVLTGKSGTGKSCLLRKVTDSQPKGLCKTHYFCHTSVGILEFYTHICNAFGLGPSGRRASMFKTIHDHIVHQILIIDEADKLGNDILQEIRLIADFNYDSFDAVTILLCGQESLLQKFGLSILESLANSVTAAVEKEHVQAILSR